MVFQRRGKCKTPFRLYFKKTEIHDRLQKGFVSVINVVLVLATILLNPLATNSSCIWKQVN